MTINDAMAALVAELESGDVPTPLQQRFTLGLIWDDLARLAGEPLPPEVAAIGDGPACRDRGRGPEQRPVARGQR